MTLPCSPGCTSSLPVPTSSACSQPVVVTDLAGERHTLTFAEFEALMLSYGAAQCRAVRVLIHPITTVSRLMSRPHGGYIGFNRVPAASAASSAAVGMWTVREAQELKAAGTWPTAPTVPGAADQALRQLRATRNSSLSWTAPASNGSSSHHRIPCAIHAQRRQCIDGGHRKRDR
jgi:hypothetical protein